MLLLFALCTGINACGWICFGPIYGLVEDVSNFRGQSLFNRYKMLLTKTLFENEIFGIYLKFDMSLIEEIYKQFF